MNTWNVPVSRMTGVAREIALELAQRGEGNISGPTFPFDPEGFKQLSSELLAQANVEVLNYTWVEDTIMEGSRIKGVIVQNKSGRQAILARSVVDATGDADVAAAAGAEYVKGRESDSKMRPMSVLFRLGGVDLEKVIEYCRSQPKEYFTADPNFHIIAPEKGLVRLSGFFHIAEKARAAGELPDEVHYLRFEGIDVARGIVTVNNSRVYGVDGTNAWDISRADTQARQQNRQLRSVIRKYIPGFENAYVIDSSPTVGVRETRRCAAPTCCRRRTCSDSAPSTTPWCACGATWPPGATGTRPTAARAHPATPSTARPRRTSPGTRFRGASSFPTRSTA